MEVEQAMQDTVKAKPVKPKPKLKGRQGRPTNISDLPCVANIEVEAHHVTANDFLGSSNKLPRQHNTTELLGDDVATSAHVPNPGKSWYIVLFPCTMLLLLTESTVFWLNLTWNSWASGSAPVGNGTPHNSVTLGSQVQTNGIPNLPPSTVPSLTTKATSVSSEISITEDDQECTMPQESTKHHMISNNIPAVAHDEDEHYFRDPLTVSTKFTWYQKPVEVFFFGSQKPMSLSHTLVLFLGYVENVDDGGSFCDLHDVNFCMKVVKEPHVTTMQRKRSMTCGHIHFFNANLPEELQEDRRWSNQMLPTLLMWAGPFPDPWAIPDLELMTSLVSDFDSHAVCPGTLTFMLATWQLGLWCSNFSSTTIALIAHFLASDPDDDAWSAATVRQTCNELIDGPLSFLYQDLNMTNPAHTY
ncbi:hypothetical protein F5J12DRAFT_781995 [Pisolithus orientalis]|uniref:uncharacterized protein n=1 Tax=Pisolithus orientalis TaxID=936130 RepID=UPI0022243538|nr:uncharacterized protein F5J12DRAFT_781995 [Pisolithus orientalis]KAI6009454.1 hypothetical protein F5J12DRAFT_781995 [Pisolithus orientalis]